ncbi:hypothetical protein FGO68_gene7650 [Halteria grandinella]|uniref:Uncharacterized protein n=1 Tax=Halteria grandinella TaxID=5974 RepID=A0A8J8NXJ8_HALGN|nr:hypothetical protein FGO68_gene7650 [Halteria grandinella]
MFQLKNEDGKISLEKYLPLEQLQQIKFPYYLTLKQINLYLLGSSQQFLPNLKILDIKFSTSSLTGPFLDWLSENRTIKELCVDLPVGYEKTDSLKVFFQKNNSVQRLKIKKLLVSQLDSLIYLGDNERLQSIKIELHFSNSEMQMNECQERFQAMHSNRSITKFSFIVQVGSMNSQCISQLIAKLEKLRKVELQSIEFDKNSKFISSLIKGSQQHLEDISLENCKFQLEALNELLDSFIQGKFQKMKKLNLNNISVYKEVNIFIRLFTKKENYKQWISNPGESNQITERILLLIQKSKNLAHLQFGNLEINSETWLFQFLEAVGQNRNLKYLKLGRQKIIINNSQLLSDRDKLADKVYRAFLENCGNLRYLYMNSPISNMFEFQIVEKLKRNLPRMQELSL